MGAKPEVGVVPTAFTTTPVAIMAARAPASAGRQLTGTGS